VKGNYDSQAFRGQGHNHEFCNHFEEVAGKRDEEGNIEEGRIGDAPPRVRY
jgi:hypothetical protein